jgi:hypothetical protein
MHKEKRRRWKSTPYNEKEDNEYNTLIDLQNTLSLQRIDHLTISILGIIQLPDGSTFPKILEQK